LVKLSEDHVSQKLRALHKVQCGLSQEEAELKFIKESQKLAEYGMHLYKTKWVRVLECYLSWMNYIEWGGCEIVVITDHVQVSFTTYLSCFTIEQKRWSNHLFGCLCAWCYSVRSKSELERHLDCLFALQCLLYMYMIKTLAWIYSPFKMYNLFNN
jgi:hypothetical protein